MKLIIDYTYTVDHKKHILGYWFEAENKEEEENLSIVRDQIFFGLKDNGTYPMYAGRINDEETQLVKAIGYEIPNNVKNFSKDIKSYNLNQNDLSELISEYTIKRILDK